VLERVSAAGLRIENVDSSILAERPRLASHRERIRDGLAAQLRVDPRRVNVKLKSPDGLGALGRGEGIAAQAVVLLVEDR
jgi:2-C-methyl-D-erythritol 2,4-cyclodiphosphate synthase